VILGIGIDSVEITRFAHWHTYSQKQLLRVFGQSEIEYCLAVPTKSSERFAVRFAAREALFKAYSSWQPNHKTPFLTFCRAVTILKKNNVPFVEINLPNFSSKSSVLISLSHTATIATAFVIFESNN